MAEHLRALVVILALASATFWLVRRPVIEAALSPAEFSRRWKLWIGITLIAFLSHDFWIYAVLTVGVLLMARVPTDDRLPLFLFLMFAVPLFSKEIPAFGGIRYIITVNHVRLLALMLLIPAFLALRGHPGVLPFGRLWIDWAVAGYIVVGLALHLFSGDSITNWSRNVVYRFIDVLLPYYVASRSLQNLAAFRRALTSFVLAVIVLSPIALFEWAKGWLLYASLPSAIGANFDVGRYLARDGQLRALVTTGHALVLGYVVMVALALVPFVRRHIATQWHWWAILATLLAGLWAPISRGPWTGALAALMVMFATGTNRGARITKFLAMALPAAGAVLVSPLGSEVIEKIPFIGTVDADNVLYRQRLFDVSIDIVLLNPWFGGFDFFNRPEMEEMRQGEGIIDIVNSYLAVALSGGLVSLFFFAGAFVGAWIAVARKLSNDPRKGAEEHDLGRVLLAALTGIMVTIGTASSILAIPVVYWAVIGLCAAYASRKLS